MVCEHEYMSMSPPPTHPQLSSLLRHWTTVIETDLFQYFICKSKNDNMLNLIGLYTLVFCYMVELPLPKVSKINWLAAMLPTLLLYYD
jgi:hypothetical protein